MKRKASKFTSNQKQSPKIDTLYYVNFKLLGSNRKCKNDLLKNKLVKLLEILSIIRTKIS